MHRADIEDVLKRHRVKVFNIKEYLELNTVVLQTFPGLNQAAMDEINSNRILGVKFVFETLPDDWHNPKLKAGAPMTKNEYMAFHEQCCQKMVAITKAKNSDYTGDSGDPFANFQQIGSLVQLANVVEIGFLTRMSDKLSRIGSFVTKGTLLVKDESIEDTLLDLANYCILFAGYLRSRRQSKFAGVNENAAD